MEFTCKCGHLLKDENMDYHNAENEVGEEYCIYEACCPKCDEAYEVNDWGHCDNPEDVPEIIKDYYGL